MLEVLFGLGTLFGIFGGVSEAEARRQAMEEDAANKRLQADELERRSKQTEEDIIRQAQEIGDEAQISAAHKGIFNSSLTLGSLVRTKIARDRAIMRMKEDVAFRASQFRRGADASTELASDQYTAGLLGVAGDTLSGVALLGDRKGWFSKTPEVFKPSDSVFEPIKWT